MAPARKSSGKWIVIVLVTAGILIAVLAPHFRKAPPTTTTRPATAT